MTGLELSRAYYKEFGLPMLEKEFGDKLDRIATGLVGHGSECFGFDDEISKDHDFEPGFCIWLTDEDEKDFGFKLFRAYSKLPSEYEGIKLQSSSVYGNKHKGVHTISEFYSFYLGPRGLPKTNEEWLMIPENYLAEATNGEVFSDPLDEFTKIRDAILNGVPEDVWFKRLASSIFGMAQKGQYNYKRCLLHGEKGAAVLAFDEYCRELMSFVFCINRVHMPYYKWALRAMRDLKVMGDLSDEIETNLIAPLDASDFIEKISSKVITYLSENYGIKDHGDYLEGYSYAVNDLIKDGNLRISPVIL